MKFENRFISPSWLDLWYKRKSKWMRNLILKPWPVKHNFIKKWNSKLFELNYVKALRMKILARTRSLVKGKSGAQWHETDKL